MTPESRQDLSGASAAWPGFRVAVSTDELGAFSKPPNQDARHRFLDVQELLGAEGEPIGIVAISGEAGEGRGAECVVRWDPKRTTADQARLALDRMLGRDSGGDPRAGAGPHG